MSDDRISEPPNPPHCPVCATGFTLSPGASCTACGRVGIPPPVPPPEIDFRLRAERFRLDGPPWVIAGVVLSCCGLLVSVEIPGLLIPLAVLMVPAFARASRLARGREEQRIDSFLALFMAALGFSLFTGAVAGAAGFAACLATFAVGVATLHMIEPALIAGGVVAAVVFAGLFAVLWPRADPAEPDPGED